jgi:hypothetical protein
VYVPSLESLEEGYALYWPRLRFASL